MLLFCCSYILFLCVQVAFDGGDAYWWIFFDLLACEGWKTLQESRINGLAESVYCWAEEARMEESDAFGEAWLVYCSIECVCV